MGGKKCDSLDLLVREPVAQRRKKELAAPHLDQCYYFLLLFIIVIVVIVIVYFVICNFHFFPPFFPSYWTFATFKKSRMRFKILCLLDFTFFQYLPGNHAWFFFTLFLRKENLYWQEFLPTCCFPLLRDPSCCCPPTWQAGKVFDIFQHCCLGGTGELIYTFDGFSKECTWAEGRSKHWAGSRHIAPASPTAPKHSPFEPSPHFLPLSSQLPETHFPFFLAANPIPLDQPTSLQFLFINTLWSHEQSTEGFSVLEIFLSPHHIITGACIFAFKQSTNIQY